MASKNVELKKKIGNDIYDLNVKTDASMVSYDGLSVKDTLDAYTNSIDGLEQASSGLDTRVESLETAVGGVSSGLVKNVSDLDEAINNASTGIAARVGTLESASVVMTGATNAANGAQGFVPAPATGDQDKFLNGAGQWATPLGATYSAATTGADGLMSSTDKAKLDGIAASANNYSHPAHTSKAAGMYKITVDSEGHVSDASAVTKADITGLGIPGSDTTYSAATTAADGLMSSADKDKLESIAASANKYTHPSYNSAAAGLYKVAVDATGHVSSTSAVGKADITGLGIPGSDTTYADATTAVSGLMSSADKTKLNGLSNYTHPAHDSAAPGLYKVAVDSEGHVSGTTAVAKADITGLGIPGSDTTYADATTAAHGLMSSSDKGKLDGLSNYAHPSYDSHASGLYKVAVDATGHVNSTSAVEKADITGLGIPGSDTTYADATTAAHGLMTAAQVTKLNGIAANANNYSHPSYTSKAAGLYKMTVDTTGHVSETTAVQKSDITGLGIPESDTTYAAATTAAEGLMSASDKTKLNGLENYTHPSYTSKAPGLYKVAVDSEGHVSGTTAIAKSDITGLGIPGSDTTYADATTAAHGLMTAAQVTKLNGITANANNYSHPSFTSKAAGLYKITVNGEGHVSGTTAVSKDDITALDIPGSDTTYADGTTTTHGLMSTADKAKLDSIAASANNYTHPSYTSKAAGLYKMTVDAAGHVSGTTAVAAGDITGLGIASTAAAATNSAGLMSANDKKKLDSIAASANNYSHPSYTAKDAGLYKMTVDATGHVSGTTAVAKADITGLGIPGSDTTYDAASTTVAGLMSTADKAKLDSIAASANKYSHPSYTSKAAGIYKMTVDATGHVSGTTAIAKSDITGLGIPGSDTTYADATTAVHGLMSTAMVEKLNGIAAGANAYSHPSYTSKAAGLYKMTVDGTGHVSGTTAVAAGDITGLGIASTAAAATNSAGLMSADDKAKLDSIAASANKYSHPSYTSKAAGIYKMTVDATGHVSATTAIAKSDITGLGIPGSDTTYSAASTTVAGLMSTADKAKLDSIAASANKYSHPSYTSKAAGIYKMTVDATGHVSATTAIAKSDITGLGIPGSDTTYADATTAVHGLMSTAMVEKLNGIAAGANAYSHPSYTSKAAGLYKITVDTTGHVSGTTAVGNASTAAAGLMTAAQASKLESIAASANNYSHPSYTSKAAGIYKMTVDATGHVSATTAIAKSDITGLGIPGSDTTYADATTAAAGLMSTAMVSKLNGIAAGANAYSHPSYTARSSGFYKVTVDSTGHVNAVTAVAKGDITGLGIPGSDTTYGAATTAAAGLMSTAMVSKLNGIAASANAYSHPGYTSYESGLYKVTVDATGHVSSAVAIAKADITGLGIPGSNTTYADATTAAHGLMTTAMVSKLNGIASGANAYTHPSYTSKAAGIYKMTVDATGHVSATTAIAKSDITGLGIPGSDTTYADATTAAAGLMSTAMVSKLNGIAAGANAYTHPSYTSKAAGIYKITVDATGHVSGTTAVAKSDITGLGIPSSNTTYAVATTAANGLMGSTMLTKLNSIAASANNYSHPSYTSKAAGLYKMTVDGTGHVSGTTAVAQSDITGLGIASTAVASTSAKGIVQIGSNLTVSNGVVSLTATNISAALGYEPIGASYDSATSAIVFGLQSAS